VKQSTQILCISPRFAPSSEADTHRLRLLLRYANEAGWNPVVVGVEADCLSLVQDPWLATNLPSSLEVHRINIPRNRFGLSSVFIRAWRALDDKVRSLLSGRKFDLVFFSTNEFPLTVLALGWQRDFGIPFCMDYQDPWVNDYYRLNRHIVPPGGRLKYGVIDKLHRMAERAVVRRCSGFLSVSPAYLPMLEARYGDAVVRQPRLIAGFPAEPAEMIELAAQQLSAPQVFGSKTWRYIGRGGADMVKAAQGFFQAWVQAEAQGALSTEGIRFEAIGTSYATAGQGSKTFEPLVVDTTLYSRVAETPERLGYSYTLRALLASDALVVFGSDDPAYTASKIYPYLLAGKPLLAIFHENSSVVSLMRRVGGGVCVTFNEQTTSVQLANQIRQKWFDLAQFCRPVQLDQQSFDPYTARQQSQDVGQWFQEVLTHANIT
jgi:hypothetical protein